MSTSQLINQISTIITPINHIIYEFVVLILVYIAIKKTQNIEANKRYRWSFLFLFAIFAIGIDWYIWLDINKTVFFALIICIYIYYNIHNEDMHSQFINIINNSNYNTNQLSIDQQHNIMTSNANKTRIDNQINNLIYNPPDLNPRYLERTEYIDANTHTINPIDGTLQKKQDNYTNTALTSLYNSSQYHNILKNDIDQYLDNNIHCSSISKQTNWENYALFKNPKREFLDSNWVHIKTPWYNDHCYSNGEENEFVKFGYKLENCTNKNPPLDPTMTLISSNEVRPILQNFTGGFN